MYPQSVTTPARSAHTATGVKRWVIIAAAVTLTLTSALGYELETVAQDPASTPGTTSALSVADVAERANAAVVTIYTYTDISSRLPDGVPTASEQTPLGAGSGWIYSADGLIVTNAHVVAGADSFTIQYADGTQVSADLIGSDSFQDVAVLKINLGPGETVPAIADVGDSSALRAGEEVVAIGSPLGEFTNSVSDGNVGGLDRSLDAGNGMVLENLIQHDAEISSGNSGGPLLNMRGEVIGMNVARLETANVGAGITVSGLNFAIDGNTVVETVGEIIDQGGSIQHAYLGVQIQATEEGLVVVAVEPGSPADEAGFVRGDILVGIDGEAVEAGQSFMQLLQQYAPGTTVDVQVIRDGSPTDLAVTLGVRPGELETLA